MSGAQQRKIETGKSSVWSQGTTNVPKDVREELGIEDGARLHWQTTEGGEARVFVEPADD